MMFDHGFRTCAVRAVGVLAVMAAVLPPLMAGGTAHADDPLTLLTAVPDSSPPSGGVTVTVTGTGFVDGATWVEVDGVAVVAAVQAPERLTFVTPAHAPGRVPVAVVVDEAASATLFHVYAGPSGTGAHGEAPGSTPAPEPVPTRDRAGVVRRGDPGPPAHRDPAGPPDRPTTAAVPPELAATGPRTAGIGIAGVVLVLLGCGALGWASAVRRRWTRGIN